MISTGVEVECKQRRERYLSSGWSINHQSKSSPIQIVARTIENMGPIALQCLIRVWSWVYGAVHGRSERVETEKERKRVRDNEVQICVTDLLDLNYHRCWIEIDQHFSLHLCMPICAAIYHCFVFNFYNLFIYKIPSKKLWNFNLLYRTNYIGYPSKITKCKWIFILI